MNPIKLDLAVFGFKSLAIIGSENLNYVNVGVHITNHSEN